nr:unnamed protein product [Digitaria exilis]
MVLLLVPLYSTSTPSMVTPVQGILSEQRRLTASGVEEVPVTFLKETSLTWILEAVSTDLASSYALIRRPLLDFLSVQSFTVMSVTSFSSLYLPRLPMEMPWPGPQVTPVMLILVLPGPMEMQSSPQAMLVLMILTPVESPMWMPSVLGLSPGADTVTSLITMSLHWNTFMWKNLELSRVMPDTSPLFT